MPIRWPGTPSPATSSPTTAGKGWTRFWASAHRSGRDDLRWACLPGHLWFRVPSPDFCRSLVSGPDHHAFLDHLDDVVGCHRIEEEDLVRLRCGKDSRAGRLKHRRHWARTSIAHAERERHVA